MGRIIDSLFSLIAYVCVAAVVTLTIGLGYLWHNDQLNNEKLFRMMALLQDVDLEQITATPTKQGDEVPPEEPSLSQVMHRQQVLDRNHEVKLLALQRGRQAWDSKLQELKVLSERQNRMALDFQNKLKQQEELTTQQNVATVVSQLEQLKPELAKDSLMLWITEGRMDDAILLMSRMSETKLSKILQKFETPQDLEELHKIHQRIIGSPANSTTSADTSKLQKAIGELNPASNGK
jgi:hypothetical protein